MDVEPGRRSVTLDDGLSLSLVEYAPAAAEPDAPPFVLVHGLSSNARTWDGVGQALAAVAELVGLGVDPLELQQALGRVRASIVIGSGSLSFEIIRALVERVDIYLWGHAMVRPRPGFLWSEALARSSQPLGRVHRRFDRAGLSLDHACHCPDHWRCFVSQSIWGDWRQP